MTAPNLIVGTNSYVSLDDADTIAAGMLYVAPWDAARRQVYDSDIGTSVDDRSRQARALITATALLDRMRWQGRPLTPVQSLAWPRVSDRCTPGYPLSVEVPQTIVAATVELAVYLLGRGELSSAPVMQRMLGDSMVMYFPTIADELPKHVRRLIEPHLRSQSANSAEVLF